MFQKVESNLISDYLFSMQEVNNYKEDLLTKYLENESCGLLEWPIIKEHLSTFAPTQMGKKAILEMEIPATLQESIDLLNETKEINQLEIENDQKLDFRGIFNIKKIIENCFKGGNASALELLEIAETITNSRRLKNIILDFQSRPLISSILNDLVDHNQLEKILNTGIESNGRISDAASIKLFELRKQLKSIKTERKKLLDKFIQNNGIYLQDSTIGDRSGRPVLAIKINYINKIKGIVHDSSSSGNTFFIEPEVIVAKGNKISTLLAKISFEEFKLLRKWSKIIAENYTSLLLNSNILLTIEKALTRSRYSHWIQGNPPRFTTNSKIEINGYVHPLLIWESKRNNLQNPVPIDFYINKDIKVVAITGPNTGGKTAALKGLGIALLMSKVGLFIPSEEDPIIPFFSNIYADIGDKQSLEENLSTFSGHISRIKQILDSLNTKEGLSIVLLDEIGSGTDPEEGTALAISLLEEFALKSDLTIATTHYGEIKALKYKDSRFENVSVSFDENSLKPTYMLNWGIPGRSNALTIAKRIGLNQRIIDNARINLKPKETDNINRIIKGLEEQRIKQQKASEEAAALIARTEILYNELNKNYQYQQSKAKEFQALEREKLTKSIKEAKSEVVRLIEKLRNKKATGEDSRKIGMRLKEIENKFTNHELEEKKQSSWFPQVGELIRIKSLNSEGKIIASDEKGYSFTVNCGSFNSVLSINELEGINGEKPIIPKSVVKVKSNHENYSFSNIRTTKNTIDVRGLRVHEAEIIIEEKIRKFHGPLWIIHGIGTGKLKRGLKTWLLNLNYVDKVEDADPTEGGAGCSVAWIK